MNTWTAHIDGEAVPALRPRVTKWGTYDPPKSKEWKALVAYQLIQQKPPGFTGPLEVTLDFSLSRPKSAPKKRLWPAGRPDIDNLTKAILDAANQTGMVWSDDGQIVRLFVTKRYADPPLIPCGVSLIVRELP